MNRKIWLVPSVIAAVCGGVCSTALAAEGVHPLGQSVLLDEDAPAQALTVRQVRAIDLLASHVLTLLSPAQQAALAEAGEIDVAPKPFEPLNKNPYYAQLQPLGDAEYSVLRKVVSREDFDRMQPVHQHALLNIVEGLAADRPTPAMCFQPGTDDAVVQAFQRAQTLPFGLRFRQASRWSATATNASTGSRGTPITLTYSFVPDGTTVPTLTSALGTSNLFAFLNGIYGTTATWQALYTGLFNRWAELIGVTYVLETADDGAAINPSGTAAPGILGVRGDLRLAGTALDGNSGVLAFNYFPSAGVGGDMVIDTNDNFYSNTGGNSLGLRNVLVHEHGHGLGMAHVCPVNQTKLMEPFVSFAFDGPQFDDIINGQRFYGDRREPNNTGATATSLAAAGPTQSVTNLSIDGTSDQDFFSFQVTTVPALLTVTAQPSGTSYLEGPQNSNGSCTAGTVFNATTVNPLLVEIRSGAAGATILATSDAVPAGTAATANVAITTPGTYFVRVGQGAGGFDNIQAYALSYTADAGPALRVALATTAPNRLSPQVATTFQVRTINVGTNIVGSALFYRYGTVNYTSTPLVSAGPDLWTATLPPAPCGITAEFYVVFNASNLSPVTLPAGAPTNRFLASISTEVVSFNDSFDTNLGWSLGAAGDTATTGIWARGVPIGASSGGVPTQPSAAFSPLNCAFTGNASSVNDAPGTADVDGGFTTLLSPRIDLSGATNPVLTYQRWYSNSRGNNPLAKTFRVDMSNNDGSTWTNVETVGPGGNQVDGGWFQGTINIEQFVTPLTANMRIRFVADDSGTGSLIEAAVDDVRISYSSCVVCRPDFDRNGTLQVNDIFGFLAAWFQSCTAVNLPQCPGSTDYDQNTLIEVSDIFAFLAAWFAGCP